MRGKSFASMGWHSAPVPTAAHSGAERPPISRSERQKAQANAVKRSWTIHFAGVVCAALALRLLYLWSIRRAPFIHDLQTEPLRYHQWARLILDGPVSPSPPFEQSPGYPYLVAAVYAVFGRSVTAVATVQALLDAVSCGCIAVLGRRWFNWRVGLLAGALAAGYGPLIY